MKRKVLVIGAGAAGMLAAVSAGMHGAEVTLLEKNEKPGKKLYITGKGRCNLTNDAEREEFFSSVVSNPRFLYSAYAAFPNTEIKELLTRFGCPVKTERGKRVFPASDHASDVTKALLQALSHYGVQLLLNREVSGLLLQEGRVSGVRLKNGEQLRSDAVILATGGLSYPSTGSTGDGYRFSEEAGHSIVPCIPSLVSFRTEESVFYGLAGLTLKNIALKILKEGEKKPLFQDNGELLFTHSGISGPLVLSASAVLGRRLEEKETLTASIDLKANIDEKELDARLLRVIGEEKNRNVRTILRDFLPESMILPFLSTVGLSASVKGNELRKEERQKIVSAMKDLRLAVTGAGGINEAVVTKGGVSTKEIDPKTMESRIVHGLFFAGEMIDVDAFTGGFNLQIAWSTGYLAGKSAAERTEEQDGI